MADLLIDTNERGPLVDAVMRRCDSRKPTVGYHREHLVVGDYISGGCVIESKTIEDAVNSFQKGHLWRQLENMDANVERGGILIWGDVATALAKMKKRNPHTKMTYTWLSRQLMSILAQVTADFGFDVIRATNVLEASSYIVSLHDKVERPATRHGAHAVRRVSTNDVRKDMLLTIPGFGHEMVDNLLESCGSIEEMLAPDSLKNVPRMGKVLRSRLIDVLTSEDEVRVERNNT